MTNIFISQPMHGLEESAILAERQTIINTIGQSFENPYILDSFLTGAKDVNPLVCLGHAITMLSKADIAVFAHGWSKSRGCRVEHQICVEYGIPCYTYINYSSGPVLVPERN